MPNGRGRATLSLTEPIPVRVEKGARNRMEHLWVALLQLKPEETVEGNLRKGLAACRRAKEMGADLALFPEMWSTGYRIPANPADLEALAVDGDGAFVRAFGALAGEIGLAIGITFLERWDPAPRNSLCLFDRTGTPRLRYAKVHTCDFGDERRLTAGEGFGVTDLETGRGTVRVGAMICYDREFPESARILMLQGAELVLVPNACPMELNRLAQLRARAYENMMGIATVNYPGGHPDCNGHSTAFDGIAYRPEEPGSRDMLIVEAGERVGIYLADFPMEELRAYRRCEVHGNAYRRPEKYGLLLSEAVEEPFRRADRRA